jgi:hypothetical protein
VSTVELSTTLACEPTPATGTCTPAATTPCFDGVAADLVLPCAAGVRTCSDAGDGYAAACVGEVAPQPSACDVATTWSCGGAAPTCGVGIWAEAFAGSGSEIATSIALDAAGNSIVAIPTSGSEIHVGHVTENLGGEGVVLTKLGPDGKVIWVTRVSGAKNAVLAVDSAGATYVGGTFDDKVKIKDQSLRAVDGEESGFLAKLSPDGATVSQLDLVQTSGAATVNAMTIAADGHLVIAGSSGNGAVVGGIALARSKDHASAYVASFDQGGQVAWADAAADGAEVGVRAMAIDTSGDIFVAGVKLDDEHCTESPHYLRFSSGGALKTDATFAFSGVAFGIVGDGSGGAWVTGSVDGVVTVKGQPTTAKGFLTHLNAGGTATSMRPLGDWEGQAIALNASGSIVIGGLSTDNDASGHLLKVDASGHVFYDLTMTPTVLAGDTSASLSVNALAIASNLDVVFAGGLRGTANFGEGAAPPAAASTTRVDPFVARLGP